MQLRQSVVVLRTAALCAAFGCGIARAQSPAPAPDSTSANVAVPATKAAPQNNSGTPFKSEVNEVIVPVTVTDAKGRFVSDLEQKDFQIFENNKSQAIRFFTREHSPPVVIGF